FSGNLVGAGGSLTKSGAGTLTLNGSNTFTGGLFVNAGAVSLASSNALAAACPVILTGSATLDLQSAASIGGLGTSSASQTVTTNGNTLTVGAIGGANLNVQSNSVITGGGGLIKLGPGVQQLTTPAAASSYTGGTIIKAGVLAVAADAKLGAIAGGVTLDGGTLANFASPGSALSFSTTRAFTLTPASSAPGGGFTVFSANAS